jgi:hypothetical protein
MGRRPPPLHVLSIPAAPLVQVAAFHRWMDVVVPGSMAPSLSRAPKNLTPFRSYLLHLLRTVNLKVCTPTPVLNNSEILVGHPTKPVPGNFRQAR